MLLATVILTLAPWHGPSFRTASRAAAKYKLTVRGSAKSNVTLRASGLPAGWVASFCTPTFCAPFSYTLQLDRGGSGVIEFQAIRTDDAAPRHVRVTVTAPDANPVSIAL